MRDPAEIGISVQSTQQHPRRAKEKTRGCRTLRLEADLIAHLPNMDIIRRNQTQSDAIRRNQTQSRTIRRNLSTVWPSGSHRYEAQSDAIKDHPTQSQYRLAERFASLSSHPSRHTDGTQATRLGADDRDGACTTGLYGVVQDELRHLPN